MLGYGHPSWLLRTPSHACPWESSGPEIPYSPVMTSPGHTSPSPILLSPMNPPDLLPCWAWSSSHCWKSLEAPMLLTCLSRNLVWAQPIKPVACYGLSWLHLFLWSAPNPSNSPHTGVFANLHLATSKIPLHLEKFMQICCSSTQEILNTFILAIFSKI